LSKLSPNAIPADFRFLQMQFSFMHKKAPLGKKALKIKAPAGLPALHRRVGFLRAQIE
jgi:hypothetical protein